ncbi:MAG: hypothetical protein AB1758_13450 [Candidatus Eremiobacterota bacterium]
MTCPSQDSVTTASRLREVRRLLELGLYRVDLEALAELLLEREPWHEDG